MQKVFNNGDDDDDTNIYASIACMSGNEKSFGRYFGESLQFTNWILDSEATCHMTPQVSVFLSRVH